MLKFYWNKEEPNILVDENGVIYELESDGSITSNKKWEYEYCEGDIELNQLEAYKKLEEQLSGSYDLEIDELTKEIIWTENNKFKALLKLRKGFEVLKGE